MDIQCLPAVTFICVLNDYSENLHYHRDIGIFLSSIHEDFLLIYVVLKEDAHTIQYTKRSTYPFL